MMIETFKDHILKLEPFYINKAVKNIYSWKELENLINYRPAMSISRFKPSGKIPDNLRYWPQKNWLTNYDTYPADVIENIIDQHHFHICDASRVNKKINRICSELEELTGLSADAHIYADLRKDPGIGFGIHYDFSHNLIVQIEGKMEFTMWPDKGYNDSDRILTELHSDPLFRIILEPGDIVFAPANYYHMAISLTKRLSISFPCLSIPNNLSSQERHWISLDIPNRIV
jgi:hypothetical protein